MAGKKVLEDKIDTLRLHKQYVIEDIVSVINHFISQGYNMRENDHIPQEMLNQLDAATRECLRLRTDISIKFGSLLFMNDSGDLLTIENPSPDSYDNNSDSDSDENNLDRIQGGDDSDTEVLKPDIQVTSNRNNQEQNIRYDEDNNTHGSNSFQCQKNNQVNTNTDDSKMLTEANANPGHRESQQTVPKRAENVEHNRVKTLRLPRGEYASAYPLNVIFHGFSTHKMTVRTPKTQTVYFDEKYCSRYEDMYRDDGRIIMPFKGFFKFHLSYRAAYPRNDSNTKASSSCVFRITKTMGKNERQHWSECATYQTDWSNPPSDYAQSEQGVFLRKGDVIMVEGHSTQGSWYVDNKSLNLFVLC